MVVLARFLSLVIIFLILTIFEYLAGRLLFALGFHRIGIQLVGMSGWFPGSLSKLCIKANIICDGHCKIYTCPWYYKNESVD